MSNNQQEIESKFYVRALEPIEVHLKTLGAVCIAPRQFEYNLRFDDAQANLQRQHKVLRLRRFDDVRLTFKGPGQRIENALSRTEIELVVHDFESARAFLEGLGYHTVMVYEKFRAMYNLEGALITLDELPYGNFIEIEGDSPATIAALAQKLGLNPQAAIPLSYQGLFERVKAARGLTAQDLSFSGFEGLQISALDLGVTPAD